MRASKHYGVSKQYINFLTVNLANARKLFRLFKSLLEYKKINEILGKAESMPMHKLILALIPRVCFFFFWMLDHLVVLSKIKFS